MAAEGGGRSHLNLDGQGRRHPRTITQQRNGIIIAGPFGYPQKGIVVVLASKNHNPSFVGLYFKRTAVIGMVFARLITLSDIIRIGIVGGKWKIHWTGGGGTFFLPSGSR